MKLIRLIAPTLFTVAFVACSPTFDADTNLRTTIQFSADLSGACAGSGTIRSDDGKSVTNYTKETVNGGDCSIVTDWTGQLADTADIRQKIQQKADENGVKLNDVSIAALTITVENASLQDRAGAVITPPHVPAFAAHVDMAADALLDVSGQDLQVLIASPITVQLQRSALDAANHALRTMAPIEATGHGTLLVGRADVERLRATAAPAKISFDVMLDIKASASVKLF